MRWDREDICLWGAIGIIVAAVVYFCGKDHERLMAQCMADGRKEYECRVLLSDHSGQVLITIPLR